MIPDFPPVLFYVSSWEEAFGVKAPATLSREVKIYLRHCMNYAEKQDQNKSGVQNTIFVASINENDPTRWMAEQGDVPQGASTSFGWDLEKLARDHFVLFVRNVSTQQALYMVAKPKVGCTGYKNRCNALECCSSPAKLLRCGRCKLVKYCGPSCQKAHWPVHKGVCSLSSEIMPTIDRIVGVRAAILFVRALKDRNRLPKEVIRRMEALPGWTWSHDIMFDYEGADNVGNDDQLLKKSVDGIEAFYLKFGLVAFGEGLPYASSSDISTS